MNGLPEILCTITAAALVFGLMKLASDHHEKARRVPDGLDELPPRPLGAARATHGHLLPSVDVTRSMGGERDGVPVRIDEIRVGKHSMWVIEVGRVTSRLMLRGQTVADNLVNGPTYEACLGDPSFDRPVLVRGDDAALYALLDAPVRALVVEATRRGLIIGDGAIVWTASGSLSVAGALADSFELARALVTHLSVPESAWDDRLAATATADPVPTVRVGALACLATRDLARARKLAAELDVDPRWVAEIARDLAGRGVATRASLTASLRGILPGALDPVDAALARLDAGLALESTGRVSIAEGEGGELALAREPGAVSIATEREG